MNDTKRALAFFNDKVLAKHMLHILIVRNINIVNTF